MKTSLINYPYYLSVLLICITPNKLHAQDENQNTIVNKISELSENTSFLWKSGNCSWTTKRYTNIPGDILKSIAEKKFEQQLPFESQVASEVDINQCQLLFQYLSRCVAPAAVETSYLQFNKNGWRLDQYADVSQLMPKADEAVYKNPQLPNQGISTTIQIGNVRWTRMPRDIQFTKTQGVEFEDNNEVAPVAFGNVLPMFFVRNIFKPISGRTVEVTPIKENSFRIKATANQGQTLMDIKNVGGAIVMVNQVTSVGGNPLKAGSEFGTLDVTGEMTNGKVKIPKFSIDVSKRGESDNVDIVIREFNSYSCEKVDDVLIVKDL